MRRRLFALAASVAVLLGPMAAPAHAAGFNCNTGMVCLYNDAGYAGTVTAFSNPGLGCHSLSGSVSDNQVSSLHNYTGFTIQFQVSSNCSNFAKLTADPHESFSNLSGSGFNDGISSFRVVQPPAPAFALKAYARDGSTITPCIHGMFCTYTNSGYSGQQLSWLWPTGCWNFTNQFNNAMSSFHNYTNSVATIYDAPGCPPISQRIPHYSFSPPADIKNLNALPYWPFWNDVVSSVYFGTPPQGAAAACAACGKTHGVVRWVVVGSVPSK